MSDQELEQVAGGMPCGWICSYTLDCDWSTLWLRMLTRTKTGDSLSLVIKDSAKSSREENVP
ncbi:hypothetical protein GCM10020331_100440 [Ectobacillus funiculus]